MARELLIAGGSLDPQLDHLVAAARDLDVAVRELRVGPTAHPRLHWDLQTDSLHLDGQTLRPDGAFVRHDVFGWLADPRQAVSERARAWHDTLTGWLRHHPNVRWLNREAAPRTSGQKPFDLAQARISGMRIPATWLSNDLDAIGRIDTSSAITKPVSGGQHCRPLGPSLEGAPRRGQALAAPAMLQERVDGPDLRVFLVGSVFQAFRTEARTLDVRDDAEARPVAVVLPDGLREHLVRFQRWERLDFAALDFKEPVGGGPPVFLECNRQPMFAAYDAACGGRLSRAMVDWLMPGRQALSP